MTISPNCDRRNSLAMERKIHQQRNGGAGDVGRLAHALIALQHMHAQACHGRLTLQIIACDFGLDRAMPSWPANSGSGEYQQSEENSGGVPQCSQPNATAARYPA
jgi:hypothetical protein